MSVGLRNAAVCCWIALTLSVAAYAVLKADTTAADLPFVTGKLARLLDEFYDVRTMWMAMIVTVVPAVLWFAPEFNRRRRVLFIGVLGVLVAGEFAQCFIPTRRFGWPDVAYTLAGPAIVEAVVGGMQWCKRQWLRESCRH